MPPASGMNGDQAGPAPRGKTGAKDKDQMSSLTTAPFGPAYPVLGLAKFRKIKQPSPEQRRAHGEAVGEAIRALQKRELQRELPEIRPSCASGTWHNNGDGKVGEAVRAQHRAALLAWPGKVRSSRTEAQWQTMYQQAMADKNRNGETPAMGGAMTKVMRVVGFAGGNAWPLVTRIATRVAEED
jgi:hypothetical protein